MNLKALWSGLVVCAVGLVICLSLGAAEEQQSGSPRRVKVLFLGDNGHHKPLDRCRQVFEHFAQNGIDFTYTDRMSDLNPQTLSGYDAVLLYANVTQITPGQEKALLDFVASGKGFVPVHCGSYCFLNSPAITALTGGRFKSHGTGVFKETIVNDEHPVMKGLEAIESWDETYVHEMHNEKDRTVLSVREEASHKEPYTWVRTHGEGRVFYTAWGHDERTWGDEDFQNLLERGIRWASGDWALAADAKVKQKPFEYTEANLPNYLPGKDWGTTGEPIRVMQKPLEPEASMKRMVVPPGFEVKLFASDPQIKKPICMTWDERGRLWIAETYDYPNEMQPEGEGRDRITICEDTNGDGKADKFTVFADKLSIPTSMIHANGGVIVMQAPHTLFLKDTDGDDKADVREIMFTGWGTNDTHAGPSNMRWGMDNWIYATVGYSGFRGTVGGKPASFTQGIFRMKPDGSAIEFLGSLTNNTWGLGISEEGRVFASTANRDPSFFLAIPNRYYEQVRGWPVKRLENIADTSRFYAITDKVRQVDQHQHYTAGAGHALYTARSFPKHYWNRMAFIAEPTGHLLGQFSINPSGSGYTVRNEFNLLASDDEWTSPIMGEVGPDGSVWMIDWYNYIIQHNPIPQGFEKGKGNAYETPLRDKRHGRIYRLVWGEGKPSKVHDLAKASSEQLVEALKSENQLWRMHAQRLIVERGDQSIAKQLIGLVDDKAVDEVGLNVGAIHALWSLHGLGLLGGSNADATAAAVRATGHPSAGVRLNAAKTLAGNDASLQGITKLLNDSDPQVRKAALLALSEMPASDAAGAAILSILGKKENEDDRWIGDAAVVAAARHDAGFLQAAFAAYRMPEGQTASAAQQVNLIPNSSFEEAEGERPKGWRPRHYSGTARQQYVAEGRGGTKAVRLESEEGADTSWFTNVPVEPNAEYKLSAWIRTENVSGAMGALLNVHGTDFRTSPFSGTSDWRKVELTFNSGDATQISINCLFGGWGRSKGVAWYDDLELKRVGSANLPGAVGKVLGAVTRHYAARGPVDSVVPTLLALKESDPRLAAVVLDAIAVGWPDGTSPEISERQLAELRGLLKVVSPETRERMLVLAGRWGQQKLFAEELATARTALESSIKARRTEAAERVDAAKRLLALDDSAASVQLVLKQITPTALPQVQADLLESVSVSGRDETGAEIVKRWSAMTPATQRSAVSVLLRKPAWTEALLNGIEAGAVNVKDLRAEHWQALTRSRNRSIARRARELEQSTGGAPNPDKQKVIEALMPQLAAAGDAVRGKQVYAQNCAVCHAIDGEGGKVGPDLTGIGARPKSELIGEIIDPNRSVEGTYRQWTVETKTEILYGRLMSESNTSIEVIDAAGKTYTIPRSDVTALVPSDMSVMPEGFEGVIKPQELNDLLEFLGSSKATH